MRSGGVQTPENLRFARGCDSTPATDETPAMLRYARAVEDRFFRQARNEPLLREVNERIAELGQSAQAWSDDGVVEFLCECGEEGGCGERVRMPPDAYKRMRQQDDRFVVRPGHETLEIERAVEWTEDYV